MATGNWEYKDFVYPFKKGETWYLNGTEGESRIWFWNNYQSRILPELHTWLDQGWEPVTEVGPAGFRVRWYNKFRITWLALLLTFGLSLIFDFANPDRYCEPLEFRVAMRRRS